MKYYTVKELQTNKAIIELQNKGVYIVECIPTKETYIGSTKRKFRQRWKEIRKHSKNKNKKISKLFHQRWEEYGDKGFRFGVLEVCENTLEREQYWIDYLEPELNINKSTDNTKPLFDDRWEKHYLESQKNQPIEVITKNYKEHLALDNKTFIVPEGKRRLWCLTNKETLEQYFFKSLKQFAKDNSIPYQSIHALQKSKLDVGWNIKLINY